VFRYPETESVCINTIETEVGQSRKLRHGWSFASQEERLKHIATLKAERHLCRLRPAPGESSLLATGGRENDVQIWDLSRPGLFHADFKNFLIP